MTMKLVISMELDNAAFEQDGSAEVARILENVAGRLPEPLHQTNGTLSLHDFNGNHVGTAEISDRVQLADFSLDLLEALKRCRNAFYVDGKASALRKAFEGTKELVAKAEGGAS